MAYGLFAFRKSNPGVARLLVTVVLLVPVSGTCNNDLALDLFDIYEFRTLKTQENIEKYLDQAAYCIAVSRTYYERFAKFDRKSIDAESPEKLYTVLVHKLDDFYSPTESSYSNRTKLLVRKYTLDLQENSSEQNNSINVHYRLCEFNASINTIQLNEGFKNKRIIQFWEDFLEFVNGYVPALEINELVKDGEKRSNFYYYCGICTGIAKLGDKYIRQLFPDDLVALDYLYKYESMIFGYFNENVRGYKEEAIGDIIYQASIEMMQFIETDRSDEEHAYIIGLLYLGNDRCKTFLNSVADILIEKNSEQGEL